MEKTTVNIRMNKADKEAAKAIFNDLGLDMSTAVNMFIRQTIIANGLPFTPTLNVPERVQVNSEEELRAKLDEGEQAIKEGRVTAAEDFFAEMSRKYGFKL